MTDETEVKPDGAAGGQEQGQFGIQKIYVKDLSFEVPNSPMVFQEEWEPTVNMDLANSATRVSEGLFEAVLSVTVTVKSKEKTIYLVETQQAGIFHISGLPDESINRMLAVSCPNILFPFAREVISDLVTRGGFPQLLLAPVNFDALQAEKARQEAGNRDSSTTH